MPRTREIPLPSDIAGITRDISRGDHAAFDAFYSHWFPLAFAVARACTRADESTCLDIVQDTMLRVIKSIPVLHTTADVDRWLAHVTRRVAIDHLRRAARAAARSPLRATDRVIDRSAPQTAPPPHVAGTTLASDEHAQLAQAFSTLDPRDAELLLLRFSGGLTLDQLSQVTGGTRDAAHGRIRRAIASLRNLLNTAAQPLSLLPLLLLHCIQGAS